MHSPSSYFARTLVAAAFLSLTASWADSYKGPTPPAVYTQECGSCHMAYPAGLLPAASWQQIMRGLKTHYGLDASLDETSQLTLTTWLTAQAGTGKYAREAPKDQRITLSAWFVRKHRAGEVPTAVWRRKSVGSPANCVACHADAERGDFNEDKVRIPP